MIHSDQEQQKVCKNSPFRQGLLWGFTSLSFFVSKPFGFFCLFLILLHSNEKYGYFALTNRGNGNNFQGDALGECEQFSSHNQRMEWMLLELRKEKDSLQNKTIVAQLEHILSMAGQLFARQLLDDSGSHVTEFLTFSLGLTLEVTRAYSTLECNPQSLVSLSQLEEIMDLLVATFESQWEQLHTAQPLDFHHQKEALETLVSSCSVACLLP